MVTTVCTLFVKTPLTINFQCLGGGFIFVAMSDSNHAPDMRLIRNKGLYRTEPTVHQGVHGGTEGGIAKCMVD